MLLLRNKPMVEQSSPKFWILTLQAKERTQSLHDTKTVNAMSPKKWHCKN